MTTTNSRIITALAAAAVLTGCADRADTSVAAPNLAPISSDASEPSVVPDDSSDDQPPATLQLAAVALRFDGQQVLPCGGAPDGTSPPPPRWRPS